MLGENAPATGRENEQCRVFRSSSKLSSRAV
jgi:hypothetical protein